MDNKRLTKKQRAEIYALNIMGVPAVDLASRYSISLVSVYHAIKFIKKDIEFYKNLIDGIDSARNKMKTIISEKLSVDYDKKP